MSSSQPLIGGSMYSIQIEVEDRRIIGLPEQFVVGHCIAFYGFTRTRMRLTIPYGGSELAWKFEDGYLFMEMDVN